MGHIVQYENDLNPYMHTLSCILEQCVLSSICSLHYCCSSPGKQHGSSRVEWWMVIRKKVCILISQGSLSLMLQYVPSLSSWFQLHIFKGSGQQFSLIIKTQNYRNSPSPLPICGMFRGFHSLPSVNHSPEILNEIFQN